MPMLFQKSFPSLSSGLQITNLDQNINLALSQMGKPAFLTYINI